MSVMDDDTKPFPIQQGIRKRDKSGRLMPRPPACTIPWWLAEEAYKVYVSKYGDVQSLERIAERGGFSREELLWLLREGGKTHALNKKGGRNLTF
jgi:hypothetical protein